VCSSAEVGELRHELGKDPLLVVPGIRPTGSEAGDQKRVGTPRAAIQAGASLLVVARPIIEAEHPRAAAEAIAREIEEA
jgi:orotidine-5'-phosphate decarboxylase